MNSFSELQKLLNPDTQVKSGIINKITDTSVLVKTKKGLLEVPLPNLRTFMVGQTVSLDEYGIKGVLKNKQVIQKFNV